MPKPSKRAVDMIVAFEVTSEAVYIKKYQNPEWPGGASGVTIGVGYDVGYVTAAKLVMDWGAHLPASMVTALKAAVGVTGSPAQSLAKELHASVSVPWKDANAVFETVTLPETSRQVSKALANTDMLSDDSFGALVSLVYNRGASFSKTGPRFQEMRDIKSHMAAQAFAKVPDDILAMQRLWPTVPGLQRRRRDEAKLFKGGLA
jgi:GH24 family phage-related lysozyme (muramidase)